MRGSLTRKLVLFYLIIAGVLFLIVNTLFADLAEKRIIEEKEQTIYAQTSQVIEDYVSRYYNNRIEISTLLESVEPVAELLGVRLWITSSSGRVVGDTAPFNGTEILFENLLEDEEAFLGETFHQNVYFPGLVKEPMLMVVVPFTHQYEIKGYVCTMVTMSSITETISTAVEDMNLYYLALMGILLFVFVAVYCFMVLPLRKTIAAAKAYSMGDYSKKLNLHSSGEYKQLADIIGYMGNTMYRFNEYQREIIANVSHDFRSPLTSIKGYAEAMKDGTIPPEQYEKYLNVVLFEVERLTKLTSNLLTLNTLDQKGILLQRTEFDVNDMIKNLARTFEGICKKKRLVIQLIFSAKEIFVNADRDKIAQVLYNLVDNAIKFSRADGVIRITVEEKGRKALVAVKDEGIGIPKEDLTKIWERFYKSDSSRGKDKKGTGLGLSIAKEIMTAHKENITVISTEGVGTEFVFTLPLAVTEEI